jgi:hypothetical protein
LAISLFACSFVSSPRAERSKCPAMVFMDRMQFAEATDIALFKLIHQGVNVRASSRSAAAK